MKYDIPEALQALKPGAQWTLNGDDWRVLPDQSPTDDWINYRQALRDLPASASPKLDSNYELDFSSFTWPTEPE